MSRTPGEARHTHNILDGTSGARTRTSRLRNGNATARPHRLSMSYIIIIIKKVCVWYLSSQIHMNVF